ncbi:MAG: hypothetical protein JOZ73_05455 [Solirubrobacterales bacterium]|nr:hypothetical protein [Solirubrobacterales bacterium]
MAAIECGVELAYVIGNRLLGRVAEEAELERLVDEVHERGAALVVRGEPGIGKLRCSG